MTSKNNRAREKARARKRKQVRAIYLTIGGGIALVLASLYMLFFAGQPAKASMDFTQGDIVFAPEPMIAVHEMEGPTLDQITFAAKDAPQPEVAVSESFFNFGLIGPQDVVSHTFYIQNVGEAPLLINRAYTTCGCTTAEFSATVIPPGKVAEVTLTLDAGYHDVRGETVRRGLIIETNDRSIPQLELWTQASVADN